MYIILCHIMLHIYIYIYINMHIFIYREYIGPLLNEGYYRAFYKEFLTMAHTEDLPNEGPLGALLLWCILLRLQETGALKLTPL